MSERFPDEVLESALIAAGYTPHENKNGLSWMRAVLEGHLAAQEHDRCPQCNTFNWRRDGHCRWCEDAGAASDGSPR